MPNRLVRDPGGLSRFSANPQISTDLPSPVVVADDAALALAKLGGSLSARLSKMADGAAAREGEAAGEAAGARAGEKFVEKIGLEARTAASAPAQPTTPAAALPGRAGAPGEQGGLSVQPLQLRQDGTIRGEAFDAAATRAYGWRMQAGLTTELAAAYDANEDSPAGYEKAVAKIRQQYLDADPIMQQGPMREAFERTLAEKLAPARLSIRARHEAKLAAAARAAATEALEAQRAELERDAYNLGANPAAAELLAGRVARVHQQIAAAAADGTITPAAAEKYRKAVDRTVLNARTEGTFAALEGPDAKAEFALSVMQEYASGKGPFAALSLEEAQGLSDTLYRRATAERTRLTAEQKGEAGRIEALIADDIAATAATGEGLDLAAAGLDPERASVLLGADKMRKWQQDKALAARGWAATSGMEIESEAEIAARLEALRPKEAGAGFAVQQEIYAAAYKHAGALLEERKTDPLGQAHRGGLVELAPLDTTSPETLAASLEQRRSQALTVAGAYGIAPQVFRPEERAALSRALLDTPELLPGFAVTVSERMGDLAPVALEELTETGPELAHAAGVALATGSPGVAADIAAVLAARRDKTLTAKMPSDGKLGTAAGQVLGPALGGSPATRAAVVSVANLLFEREANAVGFDPADIDKPDSAAKAAYQRAMERALGARWANGVKYGGLAEVNGRPIVAPSDMPASEPQRILDTLSDADLAALPPIESGNGVPVRASDLRRGHLVTVGDGLYRVALGEPESFDPQWVTAPDGSFWTLDLAAIQASRAERAPPAIEMGRFGVGRINDPEALK